MSVSRLNLQSRFTTLTIIFSVFIIGSFTLIQLNNQLENINRYNSYQANLASIIVKNNLENIIKHGAPTGAENSIQISLNNLKEAGIIREALIFDKEGKIIVATETYLAGQTVSFKKDLAKWHDLESLGTKGRWSLPEIDILNRTLNVYIAIKPEEKQPLTYVAKVFFSLGNIQEAFILIYKQVFLTLVVIVLINILFAYLLSKVVVGPVKVLNSITKIIASGNFNVRADIHTNDELQELGETFNYMAAELVKLKERAENASPLTKLPGNIVIREEIEKRIIQGNQFVVIYADLDDFKAFNDKYGIARGDEAIKLTADILKEAIQLEGNQDDFIGHEGGDDFIIITTYPKTQNLSDYIIAELGRRIRQLYAPEDLKQGYIISETRDGTIRHFPIMTISLSGVSNTHRTITSYAQVTNIAAEVKKKAKSIGGSVLVIDKRRG
jgi:diguanylate cyclase (GGDEF)-like protein